MPKAADTTETPSIIRTDLGAIFVSLELSRSRWLITSLSPRAGEKMSKHSVPAGDLTTLLERSRAAGESPNADGAMVPDHRYSGGRARRVLDPPGIGC